MVQADYATVMELAPEGGARESSIREAADYDEEQRRGGVPQVTEADRGKPAAVPAFSRGSLALHSSQEALRYELL